MFSKSGKLNYIIVGTCRWCLRDNFRILRTKWTCSDVQSTWNCEMHHVWPVLHPPLVIPFICCWLTLLILWHLFVNYVFGRNHLMLSLLSTEIFNYILLYFLKYLEHPKTLTRVYMLNKAFVRWAFHGSNLRFAHFFDPKRRRRSFFLILSKLLRQKLWSVLLYVDLTGHNRNMAKFPRHSI